MSSLPSLAPLCQQVVSLTRSVGGFMHQEFLAFDFGSVEFKSGSNDLVSYVDKEAEKRLVKGLKKLLPQANFITEEGTVGAFDLSRPEQSNSGLWWIIDPLDGTTNFTHGLPIYSTSIALMHNGDLVLGVVNDPSRQECFYAWKGGGAWCNSKPIKTSGISQLEQSLIVTGFPYNAAAIADRYMKILTNIMTQTHGFRRLGSAAIDLAYVAAGRFEAFFEYGLKPWDLAGGIVIIQEAGGQASDFKGGNNFLFGKELVAAPAALHADILAMVRKEWESE